MYAVWGILACDSGTLALHLLFYHWIAHTVKRHVLVYGNTKIFNRFCRRNCCMITNYVMIRLCIWLLFRTKHNRLKLNVRRVYYQLTSDWLTVNLQLLCKRWLFIVNTYTRYLSSTAMLYFNVGYTHAKLSIKSSKCTEVIV